MSPSTLEAITYNQGHLSILDQLLLPIETKYMDIETVDDAWNAIHDMKVRGAPAIAIVGCLSLAVELYRDRFATKEALSERIVERFEYLLTARPTAVNIRQAADQFTLLAATLVDNVDITVDEMKQKILFELEDMLRSDVAINKAIGDHGADHVLAYNDGKSEGSTSPIRILTHCNTGSLATAGYGTALGVIRSLHAKGFLNHVYCTETRPYNQGARLTAYELVHEKIPSTLVCDDMVAWLMKTRQITAVVVGADRVVANGDTANKIGTYQLSIVAKHHGVPFYVAAPTTSIDLSKSSGDQIPIEERPQKEVTHIGGVPIAAPGIQCWNPAFDITPPDLITGGIITEHGVYKPHELKVNVQKHLVTSK